jgi:hypothetical protein
MRKSPGHVPWVKALGLFMCKEDPLKLYKIKFATELIKWYLNGRLVNMMFFPEIYIEKEQKAVAKTDQAMRKSPGHITWVRALCLFICKEDPLKLYKIAFAMELVKWLLISRLVKLMFFFRNLYTEKANRWIIF